MIKIFIQLIGNIFTKRKLKMDVERENITRDNMEYSTFVLSEIMKNNKRKKSRALWIIDWLKRREEKREHTTLLVIAIFFIRRTLLVLI